MMISELQFLNTSMTMPVLKLDLEKNPLLYPLMSMTKKNKQKLIWRIELEMKWHKKFGNVKFLSYLYHMEKENSTPLIIKLAIITICSLIIIAIVEFTSNNEPEKEKVEVDYYDHFDKL